MGQQICLATKAKIALVWIHVEKSESCFVPQFSICWGFESFLSGFPAYGMTVFKIFCLPTASHFLVLLAILGDYPQHDPIMQIEKSFYDRLHRNDTAYGANAYDVSRLMDAPAFRRWQARTQNAPLRLLDIGCGKGRFLLDVTESLRHRHNAVLAKVSVVDLVRAEGNLLDKISPPPEFFQQSVDGQKLPFGDASFDFVSCNHVLEHIFETEKFLREIRRVLQPEGLAVISVPNCAAWMNRIAFLFGGLPLGAEVGTESATYGFWPPFLQHKLSRFEPSGHIRDFTPRALSDLTFACGFRPAGWWAQNGGIFPTLQRNLGILLETKRA